MRPGGAVIRDASSHVRAGIRPLRPCEATMRALRGMLRARRAGLPAAHFRRRDWQACARA
eukprot:4277895-Alexandrium_andersonii.AAC.1